MYDFHVLTQKANLSVFQIFNGRSEFRELGREENQVPDLAVELERDVWEDDKFWRIFLWEGRSTRRECNCLGVLRPPGLNKADEPDSLRSRWPVYL
jgi:hypothetical protein